MLSLYIVSGTDASYSLQSESGFNVFRLPATEGMYARAANPVSLSGVRWNTVGMLHEADAFGSHGAWVVSTVLACARSRACGCSVFSLCLQMNQYVTDGAAASFALPSSSVTNGREYTVQSTGIYLVSAMQRMDSVRFHNGRACGLCVAHAALYLGSLVAADTSSPLTLPPPSPISLSLR